jgi:hypothetical protein
VVVTGHKSTTMATQKVQIGTFVGLQHVVDVKLPVT